MFQNMNSSAFFFYLYTVQNTLVCTLHTNLRFHFAIMSLYTVEDFAPRSG